MARILVIEDEKKLAKMLKNAFEEAGFDVDLAADGYIGMKYGTEKEYSVIILDINLPLMNGYEVCKEIRRVNSKVPIIMLTAFSPLENKLAGFEAGADDYMVKPFEIKELLARIHVILKRSKFVMHENILKAGDLELNIEKRIVKRGKKDIFLTVKEFSLLEYLLRNKGRVISKAELVEKIWEVPSDTGSNIIEVYINYLRKKIDKDFKTPIVQTVVGMGYIIREESR